ncbi:GGDEF domain-containing protein [Pelotomaculum propionicicum]|nr:GGDEF domain-containing protein [Pelotomaculum propionicicum]NLI14635.1 GGDEF domain-containing protein [Peptococcaceae bacterium]
MRTMLLGLFLLTLGAILFVICDIFQTPWVIFNVLLNIINISGAVLSAFGVTLAMKHLFELAKIDSLTGLLNRRSFKEKLDAEVERSKRYNFPFSLLFIDLDNFKQVNDKLGHALGDVVLRNVAQELKSKVRITDVVTRWGGDEFVILLPQTDHITAQKLAERLIGEINCIRINAPRFSISVGVVTYPDDSDNVDYLLNLADRRMYESKINTETLNLQNSLL